jgi:GxxExxY protein
MVERLISAVRSAAREVYRVLGSGFDESVYHLALGVELRKRKIPYRFEPTIEVFYKGQRVGSHIPDIVVADQLPVELKAQGSMQQSHREQLRSYLAASGHSRGLLINFPYPRKKQPDIELMELTQARAQQR